MNRVSKEALQVAKEITCKFIEIRSVSPNNFAEVFPLIYEVVASTISAGKNESTQDEIGSDIDKMLQ